ncbi:MAG TPA: DUF2254 domain-containing protein [Gillisia sp.]|nr:DUF2254 domain-containing protein [Gillisia sp.]
MKKLYSTFIGLLRRIKNKIIFYPTVFAISGILMALIMMLLEKSGSSSYLAENVPLLVVDNGETALTILSAIITGLISMMVFSFSMVMLLLSQASSNYSPRLLPGLISDKTHQIILGIYLGTILYCIFVLFSIRPQSDRFEIPGFSVLMGILLTVVCIYAFIFFIHNISEKIQISKILDRIYLVAKNKLSELIEDEQDADLYFPSTGDWYPYHIEKSGNLQYVALDNLIEICKENEIKVHILPVQGAFILKGIAIFKTDKELDKKVVKDILSQFNFSRGEMVSDNYVLAFKQITEIIVKAMSPGINDPGTAINGIDYLTELFALRLQKKDHNIISQDNIAYIKFNTVDFEELLYNVMAAIRTYCKHDIIIIQKLSLLFRYLQLQDTHESHKKIIRKEINTLLEDARNVLENKRDLEKLAEIEQKLNSPHTGTDNR